MKLYFEDLFVQDTIRPDFGLRSCQRYDDMAALGIIGLGHITWRRHSRTSRVRMANADQIFSRNSKLTKKLKQELRLNFEGCLASKRVRRGQEPIHRVSPTDEKPTPFFGKTLLGVLDNLFQNLRFDHDPHTNILPGFMMPLGSKARLMAFIASMAAGLKARCK